MVAYTIVVFEKENDKTQFNEKRLISITNDLGLTIKNISKDKDDKSFFIDEIKLIPGEVIIQTL